MPAVIYSLLFALTVLSAVMVVFSRHAVYSAMFLVVTMVSIAGIFVVIDAQLAAALQVLVYAGAIMVLFLFVIMLLNLGISKDPPIATRSARILGGVFFLGLVVQMSIVALRFRAGFPENAKGSISIGDVARSVFTDYFYAFEMTSVILLVAVIGAMVLARRRIGLDGRPLPPVPCTPSKEAR
jgi:NADH-quinone oxidoreductase subunit J